MLNTELFALNILFIMTILITVLAGILIAEIISRKKKAKILILLSVVFVNIIYVILKYLSLFDIINVNKFVFITIWIFILGIVLFLTFKDYNKIYLLSIILLITLLCLEITEIHNTNFYFNIMYYSLCLIFSLVYHITTIVFLIKISEKNNLKRKGRKRKINPKLLLLSGVVFIILLAATIFIGQSLFFNQEREYSKELKIYNRPTYWDTGEKLIDDFEKEFGVDVIVDIYDEQYDVFLEIISGTDDHDLVILVDPIVNEGIRMNLFEELDHSNIPNLKKYDITKFSYDPNHVYSIPYVTGGMGMIINKKYITEDSNSWDALWNQNYRGKIATFNSPDELFAMALMNIGYSMNSNDPSEIREAYNYLKYQDNFGIKRLNHVDIYEMMQSEEIWAAQQYSGSSARLMFADNYFEYVIPKEGSAKGVDNFVIPKNSKNKETAELFINFMLRLDIGVRVAEYVMNPVGNNDANKLASADMITYTKEEFSIMGNMNLSESSDVNKLKAELFEELRQ